MFMRFITGVVVLSTIMQWTGHVIFRIFVWIGAEFGNEVVVGLCRLFSAACNPNILLIVQV